MPKKPIISTPVKEAISLAYKEGRGATQIAKDFDVCRDSVYRILNFESKNGDLHRKSKSGRPRKTNYRQERAISRLVLS